MLNRDIESLCQIKDKNDNVNIESVILYLLE